MKLLVFNFLLLVSLSFAARSYHYTACIQWPFFGSYVNCIVGCGQLSTSERTCIKYDNLEKIHCTPITASRCPCECISDCVYGDITRTTSSCNIAKLKKVDEEIGKQIALNVAGAILGNMPKVGVLFDITWAAWGPVSPVTSPFALANAIRDEVNNAAKQLQSCMDAKISLFQVKQSIDNMHGLLSQYQTMKGASGQEKISQIDQAFTDFGRELIQMFNGQRTYVEYEGMLPVYKALYPLYGTIAAERLMYLKSKKDEANYKNNLASANAVFDKLTNWIYSAKHLINNHLGQTIANAECRNDANMRTNLKNFMVGFIGDYITPMMKLKKDINSMSSQGFKGIKCYTGDTKHATNQIVCGLDEECAVSYYSTLNGYVINRACDKCINVPTMENTEIAVYGPANILRMVLRSGKKCCFSDGCNTGDFVIKYDEDLKAKVPNGI